MSKKEKAPHKEICFDDVIDIIIEKLEHGGTITFTPNGNSMEPMLRDGEDVVVISAKPKDKKLRLFDVPLYRRKNGRYVLHRVIDFGKDGSYVLCGDNQFEKEKGITDEDIIGVVSAFFRKGKGRGVDSFSYRAYVNFWYYTRPARHAFSYIKNKLKKLVKTEAPEYKADK